MTRATDDVPTLFYEACMFFARRGHAPFKDKVLTETVGPWILCINATDKYQECKPEGTMGWKVSPWHVVVFYNGWAAGESSTVPADGSLQVNARTRRG